MAALVAGVQYGLSSHTNLYENKDLIFVKLTDSAQRAIEEFARNSNSNEKPTIQFNGNEGKLTFPTSHGTAGFTFSLSSNQDIEGPQGAFECVQQTGPKSLESLGTLPLKMRIHANDDVYETTRHRMAVAEENSKNKCTRVIKANGPDIGRKVKVKTSGRTIPPPTKSRQSESSIPRSMSQSSRLNSYSTTTMPVSSATTTSTFAPAATTTSSSSFSSSSCSSSTPSFSSSSSASLLTTSTSTYKPIASNTNNSSATRLQPNKKMSDVMRRPLKERLIHLLALRPYKKPELYNRIQQEGVKECAKLTLSEILRQISTMRDNTYQLRRHVWNEVQEDWPFYTEQERAILKWKKPQNLTPPGTSSDGSGHSPNSVHPGSPPGIVAPPPGFMSSKRPGYYEGTDGLQTKRPRISHYRKPETNTRTTTSGVTSANNNNINSNGSGGNINSSAANNNNINNNNNNNNNNSSNNNSSGCTPQVNIPENTWEQRPNQRVRVDYRSERTTNSDVLRSSSNPAGELCKAPSDCGEMVARNSNSSNNNHQFSVSNIAKHNSQSSVLSRHHSHANSSNDNNTATTSNERLSVPHVSTTSATAVIGGGASPAETLRRQRGDKDRERAKESREVISTNTNTYNEFRGQTSNYSNSSDNTPTLEVEDLTDAELDKRYPPITSLQQRRRYHADYKANHPEYLKLYAEVQEFSSVFNRLQEELDAASKRGDKKRVHEIGQKIAIAFHAVKSDAHKISAKKRFGALHKKMSHLRKMVAEYDHKHPEGFSDGEDDVQNIMNGYDLEY